MPAFKQHTAETAPEGGAAPIERAEETFGMVPNLISIMAEAPQAAEAYLDLHERFASSSFSPTEQQVVTLAASFENECGYCMAAESAGAKMAGTDERIIEALRNGRPLPDPKLETLRRFTKSVVAGRGWVDEEAMDDFIAAGYTKANVLEVVLGVAKKTLSNYTNHLAGTPLDEPFRPFAWEKPEPAAV